MFLRDKKFMLFVWHTPATSVLVLKIWDLIGLPMLAALRESSLSLYTTYSIIGSSGFYQTMMATNLRKNKEVARLLVSFKRSKKGYRIFQKFPAFLLQQSDWPIRNVTTHFHDYRSCYELWSVRDAESPLPPNANCPILMQVIDRWISVGFTAIGGFEKIPTYRWKETESLLKLSRQNQTMRSKV